MKKIRVRLKDRSYDIIVGNALFPKIGRIAKGLDLGRDAVIVTNRRLFNLYGKKLGKLLKKSGFTAAFEIVPDGERAKSSGVLTSLLNRLASHDKYRSIFLIALGGGVVGDLTGFLASIYKRGIPYIQIPTTLLAQVDSAIGGKTAINLPAAKNLAGAFYQPRVVISDTSILKTLPKRQIISAMAEIIKYGIIKDKALFSFIEKNCSRMLKGDPSALAYAISRCGKIKASVVEKDEFDKKGLRIILNYGHTAGHAIEASSAYSGKYGHGESVAIGMAIAADIARKLGIIKDADADRIISLIKQCGLPISAKGLKLSKICDSLARDKKFVRGANRFVLPTGIGNVRILASVPENIIRKTISEHLS